jgi:thiamine biosynthesis lipoprotein
LARARAASGASNLELDARDGSARLKHPHAGIEEGGFLKGYALDRMAAVLQESGVTDAVLDFGGQLLVFGEPRQLGVAGPIARGDEAYSLTLSHGSLSTTGTSEHGRHILNPHSGQRCPAWGSVSVVADTGLDADVLSTALYVMGPIEGRAFAESHHLAALFQPTGADAFWTTALATTHPTGSK